MARTGPKG